MNLNVVGLFAGGRQATDALVKAYTFSKAIDLFGDQTENEGELGANLCISVMGSDPSWLIAGVKLANKHGVKLIYRFPSIADLRCNLPVRKRAEEVQRTLTMLGVPIAVDFDASLQPKTDFFDTPYHLNRVGAERLSKVLITSLEPFIR